MDKWIRIIIRLFCRLSNFLHQGIQKLLLDNLDNCLRILTDFGRAMTVMTTKA